MASFRVPDNRHLDLVQTIEGRWMILIDGIQWGPPSCPCDASGAYKATWAEGEDAMVAFMESQDNMKDILDDYFGD